MDAAVGRQLGGAPKEGAGGLRQDTGLGMLRVPQGPGHTEAADP